MPRGLVFWTANPAPGGRWLADGTESLAAVARRRNTTVENLINQSFAPNRLNLTNQRAMALYLTDGGGANATARDLVVWTVN